MDSLRNAGPYVVSFRNNQFTFNVGVTVPDSESTGELDCDVVDTMLDSQLVCYGKVGDTTYEPLPDDSDGVLITSKVNSTVSFMYVKCSSQFSITNASFFSEVNFSVTIDSPYGCSNFNIANYDLASLRNDGPYQMSVTKYHFFTFNIGRSVPNALLSEDANCSVLDQSFSSGDSYYVCYGSATNTVYTPLTNANGFLAVASSEVTDPDNPDNTLLTNSFINVICDEFLYISSSNFGANKNFTADLHTPYGCSLNPSPPPSGGDDPSTKKPGNGVTVAVVILSVLFSLLFVGVVVTTVVCILKKRKGEYTTVN